MILVIDNYDSFVYNLVQYIGELEREIKVVRNDKITLSEIEKLNPEKIIISPGPKRPKDAGICMQVINHFKEKIPILGVCLGHQCIGEVFGGEVVSAKKIVHGKVSTIKLEEDELFKNIPQDIKVCRYHSLVISKTSDLSNLKVLGSSEDKEIMAIRHRAYPIYGLQFHPESIASEYGREILSNFLSLA